MYNFTAFNRSSLEYTDSLPSQVVQDFVRTPIFLRQDQARFPSFERLFSYASSAVKTEDYFERLVTILTQLEQHLHTPFHAVYQVNAKSLIERISQREVVWSKALAELEIKPKWDELILLPHELEYGEELSLEWSGKVDELLALLRQLVEKTFRFVKQNNLYGAAYDDVSFEESEDKEEKPSLGIAERNSFPILHHQLHRNSSS